MADETDSQMVPRVAAVVGVGLGTRAAAVERGSGTKTRACDEEAANGD